MSDLSESLTAAPLSRATWVIRSRLLFWNERPERFTHSGSFVLTFWANRSQSLIWFEQIPSPAIRSILPIFAIFRWCPSRCTFCPVRFALYVSRCTFCAVCFTLYVSRCTLYAVRFTLYVLLCRFRAVRFALFVLRCTFCAVCFALYVLRCSFCAVRFTLYVLRYFPLK